MASFLLVFRLPLHNQSARFYQGLRDYVINPACWIEGGICTSFDGALLYNVTESQDGQASFHAPTPEEKEDEMPWVLTEGRHICIGL